MRSGLSKGLIALVILLLIAGFFIVRYPEVKRVIGGLRSATPVSNGVPVIHRSDAVEAELVQPSTLWFVDYSTCKIYEYSNGNTRLLLSVSPCTVGVDSIASHPAIREKLYYTQRNKAYLHIIGGNQDVEAYSHATIIKCYRIEDHAYFSEAYGGSRDGKIYKVVQNRAQLFLTVPGNVMNHNFWAGYFEFGPNDELFLTVGNSDPSGLVVYSGGQFRKIFNMESYFYAMGLEYLNSARLRVGGRDVNLGGSIMFADGRSSIYIYELSSGNLYHVYRNDNIRTLYDVAVPVQP